MSDERLLRELRGKIDALDEKLVELLAERMNLVKEIARVKSRLKLSVKDVQREAEIISRVEKIAKEKGLDWSFAQDIFMRIIKKGRDIEGEIRKSLLRVAYLGPRGTFTEEATRKFFNEIDAELIPITTISGVISMIEEGHADMGVLPIENSVEGSVTTTLDLLVRSNVKICGEIILPIEHSLIGKEKIGFNEITAVYSHPQALAQCRNFLAKNLPQARLHETSSTAEAVRLVALSDAHDVAAIGSVAAAELYGLLILARGIQDEQTNETRFAVIGTRLMPLTGDDKTSIAIFLLQDRPGALCEVLEEFKERNINLTRIESRPSKKILGDYIFFIDLEGHIEQPEVRESIERISSKAGFVKILGSFPKARRQNNCWKNVSGKS
ncbi:MAG: prephenate dehydratase [Candidatus Freyarchaeota archaeon]|nr:prephenate dehydratase [Candidatus Jordarchaeia archaeon]